MDPQRAALLQIGSGLLNTWCVAGWAWAALGDLLGPWGWTAVLLLPLGVFEMAAGFYARGSSRAASIVRGVALVEIAACCVGGVPAAIVGLVVWGYVRAPS